MTMLNLRESLFGTTQLGMNNACLANQGLPSIKELWCAFHYPQ